MIFKTILEAQEYIDSHNILSPSEFKRDSISLYSLCQRNGWLGLLNYKNKQIRKFKDLDTPGKVMEFLSANGVQSRKEFATRFKSLYNKSIKFGYLKDLVFEKDADRKRWSEFNTVDKVQEFINNNNIDSPTAVKKKFPGLYWVIARKNSWLNKIEFTSKKLSWENVDSIEKLQEFIDSHQEIHSPMDLYNTFRGLYNKAVRNGWTSGLKYENRLAIYKDYTIETVNEIIDLNDIRSASDLLSFSSGLYSLCQERGWLSKLNLKRLRSYMESYFDRLFPVDKFPEFLRNQKNLDWLISEQTGKRLSVDVVIPKISLAIEFQGAQHFINSGTGFFSDDSIRELQIRDVTKHNLLISHGYKVIYFVDTIKFPEIPASVPEKFASGGYLGETIMTDWEELKRTVLLMLND